MSVRRIEEGLNKTALLVSHRFVTRQLQPVKSTALRELGLGPGSTIVDEKRPRLRDAEASDSPERVAVAPCSPFPVLFQHCACLRALIEVLMGKFGTQASRSAPRIAAREGPPSQRPPRRSLSDDNPSTARPAQHPGAGRAVGALFGLLGERGPVTVALARLCGRTHCVGMHASRRCRGRRLFAGRSGTGRTGPRLVPCDDALGDGVQLRHRLGRCRILRDRKGVVGHVE